MGDLPFLNDEPTPEPEIVETPVETEPEESKGEPEAAPPAEPKEERHIPITALLDEREKRQAKEREAEELRRQIAELRQQMQPQEKRDFLDDPDAAVAALQKQSQAMVIQTKLEMSRAIAEDKYGADLVQEAYSFFDANPQLSAPLLAAPMPFVEAVKVYQRHKAMREMGDDPVSYRARLEAEIREKLIAEQSQTKPKTPPPSIATAPGVSGKSGVASGFATLFGE